MYIKPHKNSILIIDFGSQYNQLTARRVRENNVFCQIVPPDISISDIERLQPKGIILSGGPASVYQANAPKCDSRIFNLGIPVLGICYGMQFMAHTLNGEVARAKKKEYGRAELAIDDRSDLFKGLPKRIVSWMSHGDHISRLPQGFVKLTHTSNTKVASFADRSRKFYGVQFHPEVAHTEFGSLILKNFLFNICKCPASWTMKSFIKESICGIRNTVGNEKLVLGLQAGLIHRLRQCF